MFFCFKQKTAYEMRISDWSSDVCSSDLLARAYFLFIGIATFIGAIVGHGFLYALSPSWKILGWGFGMVAINVMERVMINYSKPRSEERRVGKECVSV